MQEIRTKEYFDKVKAYIDNLSDLEFKSLLEEAGLSESHDDPRVYMFITVKTGSLYGEASLYSTIYESYNVTLDEVA